MNGNANLAAQKAAGVNSPETTLQGNGFKQEPDERAAALVSASLSRPDAEGVSPRPNKKAKLRSRSELEQEYKTLFNARLPALAKEQSWPICLNHCLMRVALDGYWQCCWYDKLDKVKGALKSMREPQIEQVIALGERMALEGLPLITRLNQQSLAYRGKGKFASRIDTAPPNQTVLNRSQVANSRPAAALKVEPASSGRASCRGCSERISKGVYRIGMQAWTQGRLATVWFHPLCFVRGAVRVEKVVRGSTACCRSTGKKFVKGDLRLVLQVGTTKQYHISTALTQLLKPVYSLPEVRDSKEPTAKLHGIPGLSELNDDELIHTIDTHI